PVGGNLKNFAGKVDCVLQLRLADLGAVRTTERSISESFKRPSGTLGARTGRKIWIGRTQVRFQVSRHICSILSDSSPPVGERWPTAGITPVRKKSQAGKRDT